MQLWFIDGHRGYYHLGASSEEGYRHHAAYALFQHAVEYCAEAGLSFLSLGGGPGSSSEEGRRLFEFKRGWSRLELPVYFCGRVLIPNVYNELPVQRADFFPRYRAGAW
jgi:hypothetical protein